MPDLVWNNFIRKGSDSKCENRHLTGNPVGSPPRLGYDLASLENVLLEGCQAPASFEAEDSVDWSTTLCPRASSLFTSRLVVRSLWRWSK